MLTLSLSEFITLAIFVCLMGGWEAGNFWTDSKLEVCISLCSYLSPSPLSSPGPGPWPTVHNARKQVKCSQLPCCPLLCLTPFLSLPCLCQHSWLLRTQWSIMYLPLSPPSWTISTNSQPGTDKFAYSNISLLITSCGIGLCFLTGNKKFTLSFCHFMCWVRMERAWDDREAFRYPGTLKIVTKW